MAKKKNKLAGGIISCESDIEAWNLKYLDRKVFLEALKRQLIKGAHEGYEILPHYDRIDVIAMQLVKKAVSGDMEAIKEVIYRFDGKPKEATIADNFNIHIDFSSNSSNGKSCIGGGKVIEAISYYKPVSGDE